MIVSGADYDTYKTVWATFRDGRLFSIVEYNYGRSKDFLTRYMEQPETIIHYPTGRITPAKLQNVLLTPYHHSDWCALEGYVNFHDREGKMAACWWRIRKQIAQGEQLNETKPLIIPPKRWKVAVGLSGNAGKEEIKAHILRLHPELPANLSQDAYDAVGIARAAYMTVDIDIYARNALRVT